MNELQKKQAMLTQAEAQRDRIIARIKDGIKKAAISMRNAADALDRYKERDDAFWATQQVIGEITHLPQKCHADAMVDRLSDLAEINRIIDQERAELAEMEWKADMQAIGVE